MPVHVVRQQLARQLVQRGERLDVLHRVGLLRVAQRDAAQAVLHEEQRLQHAGGDQQRRRAQLPQQAPAERFEVRPPAAVGHQLAEHRGGVGPLADRLDQRRPAVGQAVRHRAALAGRQARFGRRGEDRARAGRSVPDLDRDVVPGRGGDQRRALRTVGDDREPVERCARPECPGRRGVVAHAGVAVDGDGGDGRAVQPGDRGDPGRHRLRVRHAHARLDDQASGGAVDAHVMPEISRHGRPRSARDAARAASGSGWSAARRGSRRR